MRDLASMPMRPFVERASNGRLVFHSCRWGQSSCIATIQTYKASGKEKYLIWKVKRVFQVQDSLPKSWIQTIALRHVDRYKTDGLAWTD